MSMRQVALSRLIDDMFAYIIIIYILVCEQIDQENPVSDDVPECGVVFEEQCENDDPTSCTQVSRTMCNITQEQNMAQLTDCKKFPRLICGPETCPLVKGERTCKNKFKTVSKSKY